MKIALPTNLRVAQPEDSLPELRQWLGLWKGWACADKACDVAIFVEHVTAEKATVTYFTANAFQRPATYRFEARWRGSELHGYVQDGPIVVLRLRSPTVMEMFWHKPPFNTRIGVLSNQAP